MTSPLASTSSLRLLPLRSRSSMRWRTSSRPNQGGGSDAPRTVNRAKVTSSSDGIGAWVTITEIEAIGDTAKDPTSNRYHGSIGLTGNSREASLSRDNAVDSDDKIWVRDGDTLTVTYYEADHTTIIDTDTAIIDAENPSISSISPSERRGDEGQLSGRVLQGYGRRGGLQHEQAARSRRCVRCGPSWRRRLPDQG